ncbi:MAG: protein kinase [Candidatus Obscuribacterales bacterium]
MANSKRLESGTIFGGTYKIIDFIGEGGMGHVYKVEHMLMEKLLALKILKSEYLTEALWKRFRAEGQAIARLNHNNVVRIYDMSQTEDGVPYYTMDLLPGESLADYLQEHGRLTQAQALPIFRQVCMGLAYAHERGIIHRDIKPGNIMLINPALPDKAESSDVSKRLVKIVDFGIAKLTDERGNTIQGLTKPGEVFGSPLYMSPEQCNSQKVDQRSDLYSVGITLFQALTGRPPLLGKSAIETTIMHQTTIPPKLNEVSDELEFAPALETIVAKMLEKRPEDRYSSLADVASDLLNLEHNEKLMPLKGQEKQHDKSEFNVPFMSHGERQVTNKNNVFTMTNMVALTAVVAMLTGAGIATTMIFSRQAVDKAKQAQITAAKIREMEEQDEARSLGHLSATPEKPKKKSAVVAAPILDQLTKNAVENYLTSNQAKFSTRKKINGVQTRTFTFPVNFSIGQFKSKLNRDTMLDVPAQGVISLPEGTLRKLHGNEILKTYPVLLSRFESNDLWSLIMQNIDKNAIEIMSKVVLLTELRELEISKSNLTAETALLLGKLSHLEKLNLSKTKFDQNILAESTVLPHLTKLDVEGTQDLLPILKALTKSKKLLRLVLGECTLSTEEVKLLSELSALKELFLRDTSISNADLKQLTKLSNIEILNLEKCRNLDGDCFSSLQAFKQLSRLQIPAEVLSKEQKAALTNAQKGRKIRIRIQEDR